jgi:hypothetical protein
LQGDAKPPRLRPTATLILGDGFALIARSTAKMGFDPLKDFCTCGSGFQFAADDCHHQQLPHKTPKEF